jgi:HlyD family secretion protein
VSEVGDTAILRSTGQATSSTTSGTQTDEAKDFKVVITLTHPPDDIKPGLSCTGKITTATAKDVVNVPIQAVVERDPHDLTEPKPGTAEAAGPAPTRSEAEKTPPVTGIFVIRDRKAVFVPVKTGVTGIDAIQITDGKLNPGDQVVVGPYKALRTMRNNSRIKIDNSVQKPSTQS